MFPEAAAISGQRFGHLHPVLPRQPLFEVVQKALIHGPPIGFSEGARRLVVQKEVGCRRLTGL